MPYIKVNTDKIKTYTTELESARIVLNKTRQSFSDLRYSLDWDVRSSSTIERRLEQVLDDLYSEATSITNMKNYLQQAVVTYDTQDTVVKETSKDAFVTGASILADGIKWISYGHKVLDKGSDLVSLIKNRNITKTFKNGKVFLKGYTKGSGFAGRYNLSTWVKKNSKLDPLDYVGIGLDAAARTVDMASDLYNVWNDENKTTEKKICDTVANVGCTAGAIAVTVGGQIAAKAVTAAVSVAVSVAIPIPVVGTVVGKVVGVAAGFFVGKAAGAVADALTSEKVVNQVSDSVENVVGAAKAGCKVVSDKAKEVAEAQGFDKVTKTAELVGTAVVETAKVAVTAAVESVKTTATVVVESVKNFFKGW